VGGFFGKFGEKMNSFNLSIILCLSITTSACSILSSGAINSDKPNSYHSGGAYFLPMTLMTIKLTKSGDNKIDVQLPVISKVPDSDMMFSIDYESDIFSDDSFKVEYDNKGFLKTITATADDKTGQVIENVFSVVATLMTGTPIAVQRALGDLNTGDVALIETINPNDQNEVENLNKKLKDYDLKMKIDSIGTGAPKSLNEANDDEYRHGIYYRPAKPYIVSFFKLDPNKKDSDGIKYSSYQFFSENKSPLVSVDISRSWFVKRETILTFSDGVLVSSDVKKPSQALEFTKIPVNIANAVVGIPGKIIDLKVSEIGGDQKLIDAQKAQINSQKAQIDSQKDLINAKQQLLDAQKKAAASNAPSDNLKNGD
jgi:hypothetical protein